MEKDNWVSDPDVLAKITADQDLKGEWWQIPDKELQECFLGYAHLDASGIEFYLPAYLTLALNGRKINDYLELLSIVYASILKKMTKTRASLQSGDFQKSRARKNRFALNF